MMVCDSIPAMERSIMSEKYYVKITAGYKKWEVQAVKGADEINSQREYRTVLDTITNSIDLTSDLVAGTFAIEITRQQGFVESGNADTSYDDETFIMCIDRSAYAAYPGFEIELDAIEDEVNIADPVTLYNARISPARNMLRWFKSLANSYPTLFNGDMKIFFSSGTGNFRACSKLSDVICRLENAAICENADLFQTMFQDQADAVPLWVNEQITYEYPLSIQQYKAIKLAPYGYISFQCGQGQMEKGFIQELKFKPGGNDGGMGSFTLIKKWGDDMSASTSAICDKG
jgi:hypothetical protein